MPSAPASWAPPGKRARGKIQGEATACIVDDESGGDDNSSAKESAVAFLSAKAEFKLTIGEQKRLMALKSWVGNELSKTVKQLSEADRVEFLKQGDADGLLRL